jgi:GNAT superfamily N-acetyltransferase
VITFEELLPNCKSSEYKELISLLSEAFKYKNELTEYQFNNILYDRAVSNIYTFIMKLDEVIIGTASVILEKKIYKNGAKAGHIEEFAIRKDIRGFGYGRKLLEYIKHFCKDQGCYKITLFCNNSNLAFYRKVGMKNSSNLMSIYFE